MDVKIIENEGQKQVEVNILCAKSTESIKRLYHHIYQFTRMLSARKDNKIFSIPLYEIYYIESVDGKTFLYTQGESYEVAQTLASLDVMLRDESFTRIGKSTILNIMTIDHVEPYSNHRLLATLKNSESQIISRFYIASVKQKIQTTLG